MVDTVKWDDEWGDWRYLNQDKDVGALEKSLRALTERECGRWQMHKAITQIPDFKDGRAVGWKKRDGGKP